MYGKLSFTNFAPEINMSDLPISVISKLRYASRTSKDVEWTLSVFK